MSWTDERVELLKKLWGEGKTASEIAGILGGVTRNAVIGKAHRLKLSGRSSPISNTSSAPSVPKKTAVNNSAPPLRKPQKTEQASTKHIPVKKIKLADLKDRQCRWPIGDPRDADFAFCGCPAQPGLPYCAEHAKIAYQMATRKRA